MAKCITAGCPNTPTDKTVTMVFDLPGRGKIEQTAPICDDCLDTLSQPPSDFSFGFRERDPREVQAQ